MFGTFNYWFYMIFTAPQQLPTELTGWATRLSLPARIAWLMLLFESVAVTAFGIFYYTNRDLSRAASSIDWWILPAIGFLMILIPIVTYHAAKVWLEGRAALFPDIDEAWRAGVQELDRRRVRLDQYPLFIVFGTVGEGLERNLFRASKIPLDLEAYPATPNAPLRWYFSEKGIFLSVVGAGAMNDFIRQALDAGKGGDGSGRRGGGDGLRDTMSVDGPSREPERAPEPAGKPNLSMTLMPGAFGGVRDSIGGANPLTTSMATDGLSSLAGDAPKASRAEFQEQQLRLDYLCRLIRKARLPFIPINGMLAVLPLQAIEYARQQGKNGGARLHTAVAMDMEAVAEGLSARGNIRVIVSGMEGERGFREMVSRMGRMLDANFRDQPYGKGSDPWAVPSAKQMNALTQHACGAFEDWVFNLFKHRDAIQNPRNRLLFSLLCKVRRILREPLTEILSKGFGGIDQEQDRVRLAPLVCGCYFAAVGGGETEQAFVAGAFNRMLGNEQDIEWLPAAIKSDSSYNRWANVLIFMNVVMFFALIGVVVYKIIVAK